MALAERKDCKDYIGIYYCGDWKLINHFQVETFDLHDLAWSKDNTAIVVWDNPVECRLLVYSATNGLIVKHTPYENALGIKTVQFSECGKYLAAGCYDQKVRLYNHIIWKEIIAFEHKQNVTEGDYLQIFKEQEEREGNPYNFDEKLTTRYRMQTLPYKVPSNKVPQDKPNPPVGIGLVAWSYDSSTIATRNDNQPNIVWIWDIKSLETIAILHHLQPVKNMHWSPRTMHLVICTASPRIYIWSKGGASICDIPFENMEFNVMKVKWSPNGQSLLVFDKNHAILAYPHATFLEGEDVQSQMDDDGDL